MYLLFTEFFNIIKSPLYNFIIKLLIYFLSFFFYFVNKVFAIYFNDSPETLIEIPRNYEPVFNTIDVLKDLLITFKYHVNTEIMDEFVYFNLWDDVSLLANKYINSEKNKIIESKSNVNPLKIDRNDYSIKEIKVEEVFKAANSLLIEEIN